MAAVDGTVSALRANSGQRLWQLNAGGSIYCPLLLMDTGALVMATQAGRIVALEPASGQQLADASLGEQPTGLARLSSTLFAVTTAPGTVAALRLDAATTRVCLADRVLLQGEVFARPVAATWSAGGSDGEQARWPGLLVGCRDDHLCCLMLWPELVAL